MKQSILNGANKSANDKILHRSFYRRSTILVAIDLLGKIVSHRTVKGILTGKIVEVEAYLGETDPACHASKGETRRTKIFWEKPGIAYVFVNYGIHHCLNAITEETKIAGCVLVRALEPIDGVQIMKENRGTDSLLPLTNGPGKLTQALGITLEQNGADLTQGDLLIIDNRNCCEILVTSRIGISKAKKEPLRFCIHKNRFVSPRDRRVLTFFKGSSETVKKAFHDRTVRVTLEPKVLSTK